MTQLQNFESVGTVFKAPRRALSPHVHSASDSPIAPTSYQPLPPSFTTGFSPSTTTKFSPFSTTGFSPLKSILQASHIRHARTPSPDHNGLRASERMQNTAMGQRRRRRRAVVGSQGARWDAILGEPPSLSPFYSVPVRALASLTTTACKDAVSFVRRYRFPRTERHGSTAYSHALLAINEEGESFVLRERVGGPERT
ncbi:uncharacterized protein LAESUDRAFT_765197 [Laetiporus sulphureus 93-53]|uniref:Uncharacterized protein n=1 Tax=Laetiporus sulphureus 93-53 TaxID=1314785 RepID=A0A165AWH1_9APHY|nr:uncharacterized protein LAESUDRAFT_765197 [Laetiporus sulphureus 93-53]KZS99788.1 hypothetical protein LAESUDRAFT_765197 [Laetiporus sulphureus 93-53]